MISNPYIFKFGNILFSVNGFLCVLKKQGNGWFNDKMRVLFIDSIDLHNGFLKKSLPPNPPLFAINVYGTMQLFKFA